MALSAEVIEVSQRLLNYANYHAGKLALMESEESILFSFDHFLLTLVAACQTFASDIHGEDIAKIQTLADLRWIMEARNGLAHRAVKVVDVNEDMVVIGGEQVKINGEDVICGYEVRLLQCATRNNKIIQPPAKPLIELCKFAHTFWCFAFEQRKQNEKRALDDIHAAFEQLF